MEIFCSLLAPPPSLIWTSSLNGVSLRLVKQAGLGVKRESRLLHGELATTDSIWVIFLEYCTAG